MKKFLKSLAVVLTLMVLFCGRSIMHHQRSLHDLKGSDQANTQPAYEAEDRDYDKNPAPDEKAFFADIDPITSELNRRNPQVFHFSHERELEAAHELCQKLDTVRETGDFSLMDENHYASGQYDAIPAGEVSDVPKYLCKQNVGIFERSGSMVEASKSYSIQTRTGADEPLDDVNIDTWRSAKAVSGCHVNVVSPQGKVLRTYGADNTVSAGVMVPLTSADLGKTLEVGESCKFLVPDHASY